MKRLCWIWVMCAMAMVANAQELVLKRGKNIAVYLEAVDEPIAETALQMLAGDVKNVLDAELVRVATPKKSQVVATLDNALPREGFSMAVSKGQLLIQGADAHGLAYGLLEVSRLLGVSPWEWWADCTPDKQDVVTLDETFSTQQSPAVAYRGIFINDEDWGILPWSGGVIGAETNERIFQLMLRLRANYYWPAMHEVSTPFFTIEGNREMAHKYGIYVGGSHCEPMGTSPATEWKMRGEGDYNYVTNKENVQKFWRDRLEEVKHQDMVYTIGMRGVHDGSMQGVKTKEEKLFYLQQVIDDQREMLRRHVHADVTAIPQVFVPYKEVLDIYHAGLKVPDDVTLMWTDDNYGYIRHFPDAVERARKGGNGLYYHVSYWGRPHDYLWLGTFSPELLRQQLTEAYHRGIQQMWILNVGDIKPAEYQIEDFLNMAWHGVDTQTSEQQELHRFLAREFGESVADTLTAVMTEHYHLAFRCKPEFLGGTRVEEADKKYWSTFRQVEGWTQEDIVKRMTAYQRLSDAVEALSSAIPPHRQDAYFQLVQYPVQAAAQMNFKFLSSAHQEQAYDSIVALTARYNANPKWTGIMNMAPRKLAVFDKVTEPIAYPPSAPKTVLFSADTWQPVAKGDSLVLTFQHPQNEQIAAKEATISVHLLPNHPVNSDHLTFSLSVDGSMPVEMNYETYDRSEEWKQNVLRNYALRQITLPLSDTEQHTLVFKALTEGVSIEQITLSASSK